MMMLVDVSECGQPSVIARGEALSEINTTPAIRNAPPFPKTVSDKIRGVAAHDHDTAIACRMSRRF
jgi:hypothetical protein